MAFATFDDGRILEDERIGVCLQYKDFLVKEGRPWSSRETNVSLLFFCFSNFGLSRAKILCQATGEDEYFTLVLYGWIGQTKKIELLVKWSGNVYDIPTPIEDFTKVKDCNFVHTEVFGGGEA